jgi:hypothetical protein
MSVTPTGTNGLQRLRALLRDSGGLMATLVADPGAGGPGARAEPLARAAPLAANGPGASPALIAAAGPRAAAQPGRYELLIEAIYEGYLLHYETPRAVRVPDADLRLLAGDRLYAIGLAQLVELGDTFAVAELADTITLSALAQGAGRRELAEAVWAAGARAVGWGASDAHERAKELVCAGAPEAIDAMRTSAVVVPTPR